MSKKTKKRNLLPGEVLYPVYIDENSHPKFSEGNRKVGKRILCWNLLPGCEYLFLSDGTQLTNIKGTCEGCGEICENEGCYAVRDAKYHHNSCIPVWAMNTALVRERLEETFKEIKEMLSRVLNPVVRGHASGEFPTYEYFKMWGDLCRDNPWLHVYFYTKRFEFVERYIKENNLEDTVRKTGRIYPNFVINVSIWHKNYDNPYNLPEFVFDDGTEEDVREMFHCPAVNSDGMETGVTCEMCKRCIYPKPGQKTAVYDHSTKGRMRAKAKAKKFTETHPFPKE